MANISVIVPVYNVEPYLRRCVDSILAQTYTDFELILVDDGSPDNCGKICDEYAAKDKRTHVIHQTNGGLSAARNAGIDWAFRHSTSNYITFVDSDDFVRGSYLDELQHAIDCGVQISCGNYAHITNNGTFSFGTRLETWKILKPEDYWLKTSQLPQSACGKLFAKRLWNDIRFPIQRLHEDEFTTHKVLFSTTKIAVSNQRLYCYCLRKTGITGSTWSPQRMDSLDAYVEQCNYFKEHGFMRAYELARGRKLNQMIQAAKNLAYSNIDHDKAKALLAQVVEENKKSRVPFWENRDLYRVLEPRFYKVKWTIAMLGNALTHGFSSWIVQDGIGTVRQALYPPTK